MPEPVFPTAGAATVMAATATLPVLQVVPAVVPQIVVLGVAIGLRVDVLIAGFFGALVAIGLFNAVPSTGDTLPELARTTMRRLFFALASAVTAGYIAPLALLIEGPQLRIPGEFLLNPMAFVVGVGAQRWLGRLIKRGDQHVDAIDRAAGGGDA